MTIHPIPHPLPPHPSIHLSVCSSVCPSAFRLSTHPNIHHGKSEQVLNPSNSYGYITLHLHTGSVSAERVGQWRKVGSPIG